jgi:transcription-repair coupling factor (superfamily II helicase)
VKTFLEPILQLNSYDEIAQSIRVSGKNVMISGCVDADKAHLIWGLCGVECCKVIITDTEAKAKTLLEDYRFYDKNVVYYPAKDFIFYNADVHSNLIVEERMSAIRHIIEEQELTVITTIDAFADNLIPIEIIKNSILKIKEGDTINLDEYRQKLTFIGYERVSQVETSGQFAIRGGIIDIFPFTAQCPVRIELWDDEIDSIRTFDVQSQRSFERIEAVDIYPAVEVLLSSEQVSDGTIRIREAMETESAVFSSNKQFEEAARIRKLTNEALEGIKEEGACRYADKYLTYFCKTLVSFADYFDRDTLFFIDEPDRISQRMDGVEMEFSESMSHRLQKGYLLSGQTKVFRSEKEIMAKLGNRSLTVLSALSYEPRYIYIDKEYPLTTKSISSYNNKFEMLVEDVKRYRDKKYKIVLICSSRTRAERISSDLTDYGINAFYSADYDVQIKAGQVMVTYGQIHSGCEYPDSKFVIIAESDIFGHKRKKAKKKKNYEGRAIAGFNDLVPGDYVVHEDHGLGIYRGIEKMTMDGIEKDYMKIEYSDNGCLYVLATQLDVIQKYAGAEAKAPKLNKLGSIEWSKTKSKVHGAVAEIAKDLVELYAKRQMKQGFRFSPDSLWQKEFEEMFPYEETQDQLAAIEETKSDMESSKIMDRLICGDVGYGKTEIAIRAAFKAVQDGKQVVLLCPTTILAGQHYDTFTARMKDFPVKIELLSRFRTAKQIKTVLENLKKGMVDIVIGTHRVLSADVQYKDLGLLIVDEEQRFGVTHKEKIKKLRENVDVLTLTATPIPRTLHMSLVGIRDMSILEEAPQDRLPIQTFVTEYNEEIVREAINRELSRKGQVYYVYNRVSDIDEVAMRLSQIVPDARVAYAHGQMEERNLEAIMYDFINGEIDVLVSTTIIETGLDIPNVNTMIVHDADKFGLSQLYQLRGRVGRSSRTSYAFLLYKRDRMLKETAEKRLQAIREFSELGSGFKIAMKDLEIRGAGNVLGARQHGHMEAVGYDLYCKMLNEAVLTLKGELKEKDYETTVDLTIDAFIPDTYIRNETQKLEIYKRIACIETREELMDMEDELTDRFGDLPRQALNLLDIALLKAKANNAYITEIKGGKSGVRMRMYPKAEIDVGRIPDIVAQYQGMLRFKVETVPYFTYVPNRKYTGGSGDIDFLEDLMDLVDKFI